MSEKKAGGVFGSLFSGNIVEKVASTALKGKNKDEILEMITPALEDMKLSPEKCNDIVSILVEGLPKAGVDKNTVKELVEDLKDDKNPDSFKEKIVSFFKNSSINTEQLISVGSKLFSSITKK